ncbi:Bug family tripartite tricarboxylate transporter substrate binding protein [Aromatoleum diolicum]|uniref:Tripartite tricarboxylate transporter substrate binding protein n=1 Tax=Aromatoleum diolicum TaxID=75796 RepID=A0ABX1QAK0_9RHOO|nr:tripartite tricarboxylate transporter substrate-binding protein [Aromatoleum diolicum]NMG75409.1 tripartite tricarboxylate transporter substrate binding protein [Aromatoleum diolicum]
MLPNINGAGIGRALRTTLVGVTLAAATTVALAADYKILVPAAPGGGYDQLGRAVQAALQASKLADRVQVTNAAGAGGTIGLAQLINNSKGDGHALMASGKGMVSAVFINKSPVTLSNATPIARLTGEYEVLVVPASSPLKTMADLVAAYKANPGAVSWAGGFAGGVDQLTAGMIVQAIGGEAGKFNYVAFGSGGEVLAQVLGGHVTVGLGGYNEFAGQIKVGKLRALAVTAPARVKDIDVATLKEQGIDVEFVNWRGLMAAPGITEAQRQELVKVVTQMAKSDQWKATLEKNEWVDMLMTGDEFRNYVEAEQKTVLKLVNDLGLVKK